MEDLTGQIMIKYVGDKNPMAPPTVVYVRGWSEKHEWWETRELNNEPYYSVSTEEHLIPFDYNTYMELRMTWEVQEAKSQLSYKEESMIKYLGGLVRD